MPEIPVSSYDDFTETIFKISMGVRIEEIREEKQQEVVEKCISIFHEFMYDYLEQNEELDYAMYFKAAQNSEGFFDRIPEFKEYCDDAYEEFIEQLDISWHGKGYAGLDSDLKILKSYNILM